MLGKTNNDEFAVGSSNETSMLRPCGPWQSPMAARTRHRIRHLVPGGSSGGSAAAVAAQLVSWRDRDRYRRFDPPAGRPFTGTVGLKPTYGRCSRWGIVAFASSLDQAGPIAKTVRDAAIMLRSMAGPDAKDTTSVDLPVPDYEAAVGKSVKGLKHRHSEGVPARRHAAGNREDVDARAATG